MTGKPSLTDRDRAHLWHPFTQAATAPPAVPVVGAEGCWLELADGRRVLDAISSWWTINHGHAHPAIVSAIAQQAAKLDHVVFAGMTHEPAIEVAERLAAVAPGDLSRVFFSDNGSTAVEVALKIAYQYHQNLGDAPRQRFASLQGGYHGDTLGAMSVGDSDVFTDVFDALTFDADRFDSLDELVALFGARPGQYAAVILEPMVQGASGMRMRPPEFLRGVADLCAAHGVLLIADEVMTGFGRTGRMFACDHAGVTPDLMAVAKGLTGGVVPLSATVTTERIHDAFLSEDTRKAFLHGHSFAGNPIGCAAALASLKLFAEEPVLERVAALEAVYAERLPAFRDHPRVADVRWLGGIGVVELRSDRGYFDAVGPTLRRRFLEAGFLVRPLGSVVYTMPPFCTPPEALRAVWDCFADLLERISSP